MKALKHIENCGYYTTALYDYQEALVNKPKDQVIMQNIADSKRKIDEALREREQQQEQLRQDTINAIKIQQSIQDYERSLNSVPALEGFDFDYSNTPKTFIPTYTYIPPASTGEAQKRIASLDKQIEQTEKQLKSLGFDLRAEDFTQFGELSSKQKKLIEDELTGEFSEVMEKGMLHAMEPQSMGAFLKFLDYHGMKNTRVSNVIRDFVHLTPSREHLVENADFIVGYVHNLFELKKGADEFYDGNNQTLGLALVSVLKGGIHLD